MVARSRSNASGSQRGYSLAEALVVMAIVGIMSVVMVPNFINLNRSSKLRFTLRRFTSEVRGARQLAVTRYRPVKVSLQTNQQYAIATGTLNADNSVTWAAPYKIIDVDESTLFTTGFTDADTITPDGFPDIVFRADGTVTNLPALADRHVTLTSKYPLPKPSYKVSVFSTGKITAQ